MMPDSGGLRRFGRVTGHYGIRLEERGQAVSEEAKKARARKTIRELRSLGYRVELGPPAPTA